MPFASRGVASITSSWKHKEEVWAIAACPFDAGLVFTGHHDSSRFSASLWRLPGVTTITSDDEADTSADGHGDVRPMSGAGAGAGSSSSSAAGDMEPVASLGDHGSRVHTYVLLPLRRCF